MMHRWGSMLLMTLFAGACGTAPPAPPDGKPAVASAAAPAPEPTLEALGREVVEALARGDHREIWGRFDGGMQAAMSAEQLATLWPSLEAQAGKLASIDDTRSAEKDDLVAVTVPVSFDRLKLDVRIIFTKERKITGLFVTPAKLDHEYVAPGYADASKFEEREVAVGEGELSLPGTLTLPKDPRPCPVVILVHGSGPNDRDETIGPNKPFRDLAHGLATRGVGVLRYDKRTLVHGKALAERVGAALTVREETIDDVLAAATLLRSVPEIDARQIFVAGHSLGGMVVPRIAKADASLAGFVILAGSTLPLPATVLRQSRYIAEIDGALSPDEEKALAELERQVARIATLGDDDSGATLLGVGATYWRDLAAHDPAALIAGEKRPILVLQGDRDYQVTLEDFAGWEKALAGKKNAQLKRYPTLNHLFVAGEGKSTPTEYQTPGNVAPEVIEDIVAFVARR